MRIHFTVPGCPVPLQRPRLDGRAGRFYTPDRSLKYQAKVRLYAALARCPLFAPGCRVELDIFLPDMRRRDRDNIEKGIVDALQPKRATKRKKARRAIAWMDDHHIGPMLRRWDVDRLAPRVEVTIEGDLVGPLP